MKKILIAYWWERNLIPNLEHNSEFDYSLEFQREIFEGVLGLGLAIMARPNINGDTLLIYISKDRFVQS
jgi:hypothetical protein